MTQVRYKEISSDEAGQRLDNYLLTQLKGVPKSRVYRIIRAGEVRINKKRVKPAYRLQAGDILRIPPVRVSPEKAINWNGTQLGLRLNEAILFEDDKLIIINKPSGIAVHGGSGINFGVIEAFRHSRKDLHYLELVHRIDRDTSGCLVLAKKRSALRALHRLFESREIQKVYQALLYGQWQLERQLKVDAPLQKFQNAAGARFVRVDQEGKPATTMFRLVENFSQACWVEAKPRTGRMHQIRAHCAQLGYPILFDDKYSDKDTLEPISDVPTRLYLHASAIRFTLDDKTYDVEAPFDRKFSSAISSLQLGSN